MVQSTDTIIVGGGQAGLATSYYLSRHGRDHLVFEQAAAAGNTWRNDRWDSFSLVTPNCFFGLPGAEYDGDEPDGFMPRDEIVARFERYVARYRLPVHCNTSVTSITPQPNGRGYRVTIGDDALAATNVVVPTGLYQRPRFPAFSADLSPRLAQPHTGQYRNPAALRPSSRLRPPEPAPRPRFAWPGGEA